MVTISTTWTDESFASLDKLLLEPELEEVVLMNMGFLETSNSMV